MFENVDGRTDGRRTTDAGVTGILIAHLGAFGSGELKKILTLLVFQYHAITSRGVACLKFNVCNCGAWLMHLCK